MSLSNFVQEMEAITSNIKELNDERDQTVAALEAKIKELKEENTKVKAKNEDLEDKVKDQQNIIGELTNHEHLTMYQESNKQEAIDTMWEEQQELEAQVTALKAKNEDLEDKVKDLQVMNQDYCYILQGITEEKTEKNPLAFVTVPRGLIEILQHENAKLKELTAENAKMKSDAEDDEATTDTSTESGGTKQHRSSCTRAA